MVSFAFLFAPLGSIFIFFIQFSNFQVSSYFSRRFLQELHKIDWKRNGFSIYRLSHNCVSSPAMFFCIHFQRKPAHDRKHPHRKQVSVRTVTFRGPGAGICRRQLRWHQRSTKWRTNAIISESGAHFLAFQILVRLRNQFLIDFWSTCANFLQFLEPTAIDFG